MKSTALAPANIAFIKYWGKIDELLRLPENGSVSMNLDNLLTATTVEFDQNYEEDQIVLNASNGPSGNIRIIKHLDRFRNLAGTRAKAKVVTNNNFPAAAGIASSASGFAALTVAAAAALDLKLSEKELSVLARLGSGSACRSIPAGFVEWVGGNASDASYAFSLYPPDHWDIVDAVVIVSDTKKETSSSAGQKSARSSPFFTARLENIKNKTKKIKNHLADHDFDAFGALIEAEALELHAIMLTSAPPLIYWQPETIQIMKNVIKWRGQGLPVYFTIDAGSNLHLIVENKNSKLLCDKLNKIQEIKKIIINKPGKGTVLTDQHLF